MKTSIRAVVSIAVSAALLTTVAACSSSSGSGATSSELTILSGNGAATPPGKVLQSIVDNFTKNTGIKVKVLANSSQDAKSYYESSVLAHKEADIALFNLDAESTTWVKKKAVVPVTQYFKQWGLDKQVNADAVKDWTKDGQLQAFPYLSFQWPLLYNTSLLSKAGVNGIPASYDDLVAASKKLTAAGITPMAIGGNDWSGEKLFFQIAQSYLSQKDATKLFQKGGYCASADAMKGIKTFVELRDAGMFGSNAQGLSVDNMNAAYNGGKAAIEPQGSWGFTAIPADVASATKLGGLPTPSGSVFTKPTAYQGTIGVAAWLSPSGEKKIAAVEKFIKALYAPESASKWPLTTGDLVNVKLSDSQLSSASPLLKDALTTLPSKVDYAVLPDDYLPNAVGTAINPVTSKAFTAGTSAQDICSGLDALYK